MKQIKFVESPLRETLSTFRSPHRNTLEQMMQAATYAAQVLNSAAGIITPTATTTISPPPSVTYHQSHTMPPSQGYGINRLSSPTSRDRIENNTQSPHTHTFANENSPPLSASTPGSLKRVRCQFFSGVPAISMCSVVFVFEFFIIYCVDCIVSAYGAAMEGIVFRSVLLFRFRPPCLLFLKTLF